MLELKPIFDVYRKDRPHLILIVGQARSIDVINAYQQLLFGDVNFLKITVNTSQETIDEIVSSGEPYLLFIDKTPGTTLEELRRLIAKEGYLANIPDIVGRAYYL